MINEYISSSTHLADPKPSKPLLENGNQSDDVSSDLSWAEEEKKTEVKDENQLIVEPSLPPARMAQR